MRRKSIRMVAGISLLVLAGCQGAQKGYVSVSAIEGPVGIVADRHDSYVSADESLSPADRERMLRTTELLRRVVTEANN